MNKIEALSGVTETILNAKPFSTGLIELTVNNDNGHNTAHVFSQTKTAFKVDGRINAVGQWRKVKRSAGTLEKHFYAVNLFHVPHLLDTDESWLSGDAFSDLQKRQLLDANCILQQLGLSSTKSRILCLRHKDRLLPTLITTPFKILEEEGDLSFIEADKFAKSLGLAPTTADRAAAGLREVLAVHSSITLVELKKITIQNYCLFWPAVIEILQSMQNLNAIEIEEDETGAETIIVNDLEKSKKQSRTVALSTGHVATDMLILREGEGSFVWDEVMRAISNHFQCPIATTSNLVLVIDTANGVFPPGLSGKINNLIQRIGSSSLHCSAIRPHNSAKATALERYLVGIGTGSPELIIVENSHFLDFNKIKFLVQRLRRTEGLILLGDGSYDSKENPLKLLLASHKIPTVRLES